MATPLDPVLLHAETGDLEALKVEVEKARAMGEHQSLIKV